ncbi:uncharacterized protein LOC144866849 [Branchiostoma floridae x Branchiostoma japonicum]
MCHSQWHSIRICQGFELSTSWFYKPPDEFQVFHPGFRDRVSLEGPDGVDLRIENVKKEDEGSYNCQEEGAERDGTLQKLLVADALPSSGLSDGEIAAIFFGVFFGVGIVIGVTITITIFCYKDKKAVLLVLVVPGYKFLLHMTASICFSVLQGLPGFMNQERLSQTMDPKEHLKFLKKMGLS